MSEAHREYFNQLAATWDERMPSDPGLMHHLEKFNVSPNEIILDIGAGTGRMTEHLVKLVGNKGLIVMQDIAEDMLLRGKNKFSKAPVFQVCNDVCHLAFHDHFFDKVLCFSAFPHFTEPEKALQQMFRVLKSKGKLLVLHLTNSHNMNTFHAALNGIVQTDRLASASQMESKMKQLGFFQVHVEENESLYWIEMQKP